MNNNNIVQIGTALKWRSTFDLEKKYYQENIVTACGCVFRCKVLQTIGKSPIRIADENEHIEYANPDIWDVVVDMASYYNKAIDNNELAQQILDETKSLVEKFEKELGDVDERLSDELDSHQKEIDQLKHIDNNLQNQIDDIIKNGVGSGGGSTERVHCLTEGIWNNDAPWDSEALWDNNSNYTTEIVRVAYSELCHLRDHHKLSPGTYYRIIDYVTTVTNDPEARSAGHPFDIIVLATVNHTLSEMAMAALTTREGGEYFQNANMAAWRIWYSLDNNTTRFQWADWGAGTGVIYRMIDEYNNDCPYDFKNVQFKRYRVGESWADCVNLNNGASDYMGIYELEDLVYEWNWEDYDWSYTFWLYNNAGLVCDASILNGMSIYSSDQIFYGCCNNYIKPHYGEYYDAAGTSYPYLCLNNITCYLSDLNAAYVIHAEENCYEMTLQGSEYQFGPNCNTIIALGYDIRNNKFDGNNTGCCLGPLCLDNFFGLYSAGIKMYQDCNDIYIDKKNRYINFEGWCSFIKVGMGCYRLTIAELMNEYGEYISDAQILPNTQRLWDNSLRIEFLSSNRIQYAGQNSSGDLVIWNPADYV